MNQIVRSKQKGIPTC